MHRRHAAEMNPIAQVTCPRERGVVCGGSCDRDAAIVPRCVPTPHDPLSDPTLVTHPRRGAMLIVPRLAHRVAIADDELGIFTGVLFILRHAPIAQNEKNGYCDR